MSNSQNDLSKVANDVTASVGVLARNWYWVALGAFVAGIVVGLLV